MTAAGFWHWFAIVLQVGGLVVALVGTVITRKQYAANARNLVVRAFTWLVSHSPLKHIPQHYEVNVADNLGITGTVGITLGGYGSASILDAGADVETNLARLDAHAQQEAVRVHKLEAQLEKSIDDFRKATNDLQTSLQIEIEARTQQAMEHAEKEVGKLATGGLDLAQAGIWLSILGTCLVAIFP